MERYLRKSLFFLGAFLLLILVGCNSDSEEANPHNLPDYVLNASHPGAIAAYEYATTAEEGILEHIPCYCNCLVEPFDHKSVKDCFISNKHDQSNGIVYDNHGAG